jgi:hypothetical protein
VADGLDHLEYPLVVAEGLDVSFYASVDRLEKHLEAIDVNEGIYVSYDAAGRHLKLGVTPAKKTRKIFGLTFGATPGLQFVVVESAEAEPRHATELETLLREYLAAVEPGGQIEGGSLRALMARASSHAGVMK